LIYKFLLENTVYTQNNVVTLEEIRINFNNWIGKNVKSLDNGTFSQVNQEYIIEYIKICKHCKNEGKKGE